MSKAASIIEYVEAIILIACGVAWAMAGFPRLMEVASYGSLTLASFVCVGVICRKL
jgi:hypothetical protein